MQITSTASFTIGAPDELGSLRYKGSSNRDLLERIFPEMRGRPLDIILYP